MFLAQIHRRAALLNDPFQAWVASVVLDHAVRRPSAVAGDDDDHELSGFEELLVAPLGADDAAEPARLEGLPAASASSGQFGRALSSGSAAAGREAIVFKRSLSRAGSGATPGIFPELEGGPAEPPASMTATASLVHALDGGATSPKRGSLSEQAPAEGVARTSSIFSRIRSGLTAVRSLGAYSGRQPSFVSYGSETGASASAPPSHGTRAAAAAQCRFDGGVSATVEVYAAPIKTLERMREKVPRGFRSPIPTHFLATPRPFTLPVHCSAASALHPSPESSNAPCCRCRCASTCGRPGRGTPPRAAAAARTAPRRGRCAPTSWTRSARRWCAAGRPRSCRSGLSPDFDFESAGLSRLPISLGPNPLLIFYYHFY